MLDSTMQRDDPLHLRGSATQCEVEQRALRLRPSDASQLPNLRVAELTAPKSRADLGKLLERPGDADPFPGCDFPEPALPRQPMRGAVTAETSPQPVPIELREQLEETGFGGADMGRELHDFATAQTGTVSLRSLRSRSRLGQDCAR